MLFTTLSLWGIGGFIYALKNKTLLGSKFLFTVWLYCTFIYTYVNIYIYSVRENFRTESVNYISFNYQVALHVVDERMSKSKGKFYEFI